MTSTLFLGFVALMTAFVVAMIARYINRRVALGVLAGLVVWFLYAGLMAHFGILGNSKNAAAGNRFHRRSCPFVPHLCHCATVCQRTGRTGFSALANPGHAMLSRRRGVIPASALDRGPGTEDADVRGSQR
jgi:hypothetical protein